MDYSFKSNVNFILLYFFFSFFETIAHWFYNYSESMDIPLDIEINLNDII